VAFKVQNSAFEIEKALVSLSLYFPLETCQEKEEFRCKKRRRRRRREEIKKPMTTFFLVDTGSNPLAVVVREPDATKRGFTNLHFRGTMMIDSPSQTVVMAQTEHSTTGGNFDGHTQGGKLHWFSLPTL
jgi:hypothetical protein